MISAVNNILTSPTLANIAQNTNAAVTIETGLKAIGRPAFILADKDIDKQTKKYAATKEFLYQATCLVTYMALVIPVFKKGFFKLAKNHIFKNEDAFKHFKNAGEYLHYRKLAEKSLNNRNLTLQKDLHGAKVSDKYDDVLQAELKKENPEVFPLVKGAIEFGSILGSVIGLAILAPQVSHATVHPILKFCGLEGKHTSQHEECTKECKHDDDCDDDECKIDFKA